MSDASPDGPPEDADVAGVDAAVGPSSVTTGALRAWGAVFLKGAFMGAADTVPGVSGGTIALITGIYERLIAAVTALDPRVLEHAPRLHTRAGRRALLADLVEMDVHFLLVLGGGIATSVLVLSSVMHAAVVTRPVPTYAFFFGLIAASAVVLSRHVALDTPGRAAVAVVGVAFAFLVSGARQGAVATDPAPWVVLVAGAVAVTAMILPGVSGAFLLVLLGLYEFMSGVPGRFVAALVEAAGGNAAALAGPGVPLVVFLSGAVVGLFTVAHAVRWALDRYREATLAFLVALMVGALRAPAAEIRAGVDAWTPGTAALVAVACLVGVALVAGLDHFTDDLAY